jgi:hypothetical protein
MIKIIAVIALSGASVAMAANTASGRDAPDPLHQVHTLKKIKDAARFESRSEPHRRPLEYWDNSRSLSQDS